MRTYDHFAMVFFMILSPQITPVAGAESTLVSHCFTSKNAALE
ncbi:hypothetical protein N172_21290 [Pantoea dispersa EGD-AAK13]|nr:hypothetical protein N172_21290 [Pantoea dispersa EGD-AAK13]